MNQVEQTVAIPSTFKTIVDQFTVDENGVSYISGRGLAELAGVSHTALQKLATKRAQVSLVQYIENEGIEWQCNINGYSVILATAILKYYAFVSKNKNLTALTNYSKLFYCIKNKKHFTITNNKIQLTDYQEKKYKKKSDYKTYFILNPHMNHIKIGKSVNVLSRFTDIQISNSVELELLGYELENNESALHKRFQKYHVRGEWFEYSDEIKLYVKNTVLITGHENLN